MQVKYLEPLVKSGKKGGDPDCDPVSSAIPAGMPKNIAGIGRRRSQHEREIFLRRVVSRGALQGLTRFQG